MPAGRATCRCPAAWSCRGSIARRAPVHPGPDATALPAQALARAVTAWADEMLCDGEDHTRIHLLGGYFGTADIVDHLTSRSGVSADAIHTPARFGLATAR